MVKKLYEASSHGVRIDLLVRGNCSLITGVPGVSDTIRINGIIDRYLEHSRIFILPMVVMRKCSLVLTGCRAIWITGWK